MAHSLNTLESRNSSGKWLGLSTICVALAAVCWGLSGGIGGILTGRGWDPIVISFYRGAIGLVFVVVWLALRPQHSGLGNPRLWFWSLIGGVGVAGNFVFYFLSIAQGSIAVAATLMYCAPVFVYLVSFALRLEVLTLSKGIAIVVAMAGIVLLTGVYNIHASAVTVTATLAGVLSGLCYALFIFGLKYAAPHGSPQAILVVVFTVVAAILAGLADIHEARAALITASGPLFITMGVLGAGLSFICYVVGLYHTAPALASMVAMVEPVIASLFGLVVLNQALVGPQLLGMALVLVSVTALSVYSNAQGERSSRVPLSK